MVEKNARVEVIEKRRFLRLNDYFKVTYHTTDDFGGQEAVASDEIGYSKNLSLGGIAFITDAEVGAGEIVQASIRIPEIDAPIDVVGEVVRCRPFGDGRQEVAVKFLPFGIDEDLRGKLELFIYDHFLADPLS